MNDILKIIIGIIVLIPCIGTIGAFWFLVFKSILTGAFVDYPVRKKDIVDGKHN